MSYFFSVFINLGLSFSLFDLMNIRYIQRLSYSWQNIIFKHRHIISKRIIIFATRNPYLQAISCIIITGINRTFMELKQVCIRRDKSGKGVLIEPLWNWNKFGFNANFSAGDVLIEPLWNWNFPDVKRILPPIVLIEPLWNWNLYNKEALLSTGGINRTFMELKLSKYFKIKPVQIVLIEPLWNWNVRREACRIR